MYSCPVSEQQATPMRKYTGTQKVYTRLEIPPGTCTAIKVPSCITLLRLKVRVQKMHTSIKSAIIGAVDISHAPTHHMFMKNIATALLR